MRLLETITFSFVNGMVHLYILLLLPTCRTFCISRKTVAQASLFWILPCNSCDLSLTNTGHFILTVLCFTRMVTSMFRHASRTFQETFTLIMRLRFFFHGATATGGPGPPPYRGFAIILRHTAFVRTPLDGSSARWRDLYPTTHTTLSGETSMLQAEFEPVSPASERLQTHALDRGDTGKGTAVWLYVLTFISKLHWKRWGCVL